MELDEQLNSIQKKGYAEPGVDIDELYEKRHKWLEAKSNFLQGKEVDPNYMPKSKRQELIEELFLLQIEKSNLEDYGRLSIDKEKEIDARTKEIRLELEALRLIQN
jgi:hypothetical protein